MTTVYRDIPYTTPSPHDTPGSQTFDLYLPLHSHTPSLFPSPPPLSPCSSICSQLNVIPLEERGNGNGENGDVEKEGGWG